MPRVPTPAVHFYSQAKYVSGQVGESLHQQHSNSSEQPAMQQQHQTQQTRERPEAQHEDFKKRPDATCCNCYPGESRGISSTKQLRVANSAAASARTSRGKCRSAAPEFEEARQTLHIITARRPDPGEIKQVKMQRLIRERKAETSLQ